ncbi:MAG: extracellular solute-binding protein, partial [Deltaproteobacteria bacterium]|nr:extracellular solute-binding protein [Deltaproteobacteria bacterium]
RKGHTNLLAVLMPDLRSKRYVDFFLSFKAYAESHGFAVRQYLPRQDSPDAEEAAVQDARADMVMGMAVFSSCLHLPGYNPFQFSGEARPFETLFVERRPTFEARYLGFDYEKAGADMARKAIERHYVNVSLLTGSLNQSQEADFYRGFMRQMEATNCTVVPIQTDAARKYQNILQAFNASSCQALFVSNMDFAETARNILSTFYDDSLPAIYTLSPMFTMPETSFQKYELNYRLLGNVAAKQLIAAIREPSPPAATVLENTGFRNWFPHQPAIRTGARPLNVLTLDSPTAYTMRNMARIYTKHTGIPVNTIIYSYDEIYEAFNNLREDAIFDVLRLDVTWLSWFAEKILQPLDQIDPQISQTLSGFLPGTPEQYSFINGSIYALPSTPSTQVLFYRKDLFQSPMHRRMFQEQFKAE